MAEPKKQDPNLCKTIQDRFRILKDVVKSHDHWDVCLKNETVTVKKLTKPKEPTTSLPIYQAIGTVKVTPKQLLDGAILNPDHLSEWSSVETIEVLEDFSHPDHCTENNNCPFQIYRQTHAPVLNGLISPRDFINYRSWDLDEKELWFCCSSTEHQHHPPSSSFVRGNVHITAVHAHVHPENPEWSRVHYVVQVSIGGWVPQWCVNQGIVEEMSDTYPRLNKLFEKWLKEHQ